MLATVLIALVGAFYVFAGLFATRVGLTSRLIDHAISAISQERTAPAEAMRTHINLAIAALTFTGGILLLAGLDVALWAFLACAALQASYLLLIAPRWLDPADPPSATRRRQAINAFVIYLAASALVAWAAATGRLTPLSQAPWEGLAGVAAAVGLYGLHVIRGLLRPGHDNRRGTPADDAPPSSACP